MNTTFCFVLLTLIIAVLQPTVSGAQPPPYGNLQVQGNKLKSSNGKEVVLRGMSLFWSQWDPKYWVPETVKQLKCKWGINVLRAPLGVEGQGGCLSDPNSYAANMKKLSTIIEACINAGIYVIADWHYTSGNAYTDKAMETFRTIAQKYGQNPHLLYEIWNEPVGADWNNVLKPYHQKVITAIRAIDPDNVIIIGTPTYSMDLYPVMGSPMGGGHKNMMYAFHFYAADAKTQQGYQLVQNMVTKALKLNLPLFVTESGAGSGGSNIPVNLALMNQWWSFLEQNKISQIIWAVRGEGNLQNPLNKNIDPVNIGQQWALTEYGKTVVNVFKKNERAQGC